MKRKKLCLLIISIVLLLLVSGIIISRILPTNVTVSSLEKDGMFQFQNYQYGLSQKAVKLRWAGTLELQSLSDQEVLYARDAARVNGKPADAQFNFRDDRLILAGFSIRDCDDAWLDSFLEEIRSLYGEEDVSANGKVYRWYLNDTMLVVQASGNKYVSLMLSLSDQG